MNKDEVTKDARKAYWEAWSNGSKTAEEMLDSYIAFISNLIDQAEVEKKQAVQLNAIKAIEKEQG